MSNRQFIFLTNAYLPKPGATGVCVHQIAKELVSQGEDVRVICYGEGRQYESVFEGVKTIKIKDPFYIRPSRGLTGLKRFFHRAANIVSRILYYNRYPLRSSLLVKRYIDAISKTVNNGNNVVIVASYTPIEGVVAAAKYKKNNSNSRIIYYSTDTLSNEQGESGFLSPKKRTELGLKWEKLLFSIYDRIILMECHRAHYEKEFFGPYKNKFVFVSFPLIVRQDTGRSKYNSQTSKKIVFAGNLYKKMRNPSYICNLMISSFDNSEVHLLFIGGGDCNDELVEACGKSHGMVEYSGFMPYSYVKNALDEADVLLSIGNAFSTMCPSKIYEYMSTGKPIIHSYTYEEDPCLEPLLRYGNALLLKEGKENNDDMIRTFMANTRKQDFTETERRFIKNTPKYTADYIKSI